MEIHEDDLSSDDVRALLREHLTDMHAVTPPESIHALDVDGLTAAGITFWALRDPDGTLLGCGALKELDARTGEIKSMRTAISQRRRGVGTAVLEHIVTEAVRRGYRRLYLETGAMAAFEPARALYARHGFAPCGPFGDYTNDPNSVFMIRDL